MYIHSLLVPGAQKVHSGFFSSSSFCQSTIKGFSDLWAHTALFEVHDIALGRTECLRVEVVSVQQSLPASFTFWRSCLVLRVVCSELGPVVA